jgi:hypothetical protein
MSDARWTAGDPRDRSILGFRTRHGGPRGPMSKSSWHRMRKDGRAPRLTHVSPGRAIVTAEDELRWEEARANPTGTEAALIKKVDEYRLARARHAARNSARSPNHVSKRKRGD